MKLSAIGDRGAKRDFIDLYALGRTHFALEEMLDFYRRKYGTSDIAHSVMALTCFDDAEPSAKQGEDLLWIWRRRSRESSIPMCSAGELAARDQRILDHASSWIASYA